MTGIPSLCPAKLWEHERINVNLSAIFACIGSNSQMSIPGTFVLMGVNGPRTSRTAFGFRSYVSRCEGPPFCQSRITDFRDGEVLYSDVSAALACRRNRSAIDSPPTPRAPIRSMFRREMPSQSRWELVSRSSTIAVSQGRPSPALFSPGLESIPMIRLRHSLSRECVPCKILNDGHRT